mmetsp:Transcript_13311/g.40284  ORF Transcript_13311/g.40284 Transcript_13311/m.40284 type:complete len:161 (+) Transcript_13311:139-621(+)
MQSAAGFASGSSCFCASSAKLPNHSRLLPLRKADRRYAAAHVLGTVALACRPVAATAHNLPSATPHQHQARRDVIVRNSGSERSSDTTARDEDDEPQLAGAAIESGLQKFRAGEIEGALQLFQRSLSLPGTGTKRFRLPFISPGITLSGTSSIDELSDFD